MLGRPLTDPRATAPAMITVSGMRSISPRPYSEAALRTEIRLAAAGGPRGKSHGTPSSAIVWARATGPPRPMSGSNQPPSKRPTRWTMARLFSPIPPAVGLWWHSTQERALYSGPSPPRGVNPAGERGRAAPAGGDPPAGAG